MAASPYDQPGANVVFWGLVALFALGEYVVRLRSRFNRRGGRSERWSFLVVIVAVAGGLAGGLVLAPRHVATITSGRWPLFFVGLALMAAGIFIRHWAVLSLGRFFTVDVRVEPGQTVVESGPYRWVRHPSYTGMVVFFAGLGLALSDWASAGDAHRGADGRAHRAPPLRGAGPAGRLGRAVSPVRCHPPASDSGRLVR